ncbi:MULTISPECIES: RNA polymerase sigma factor [Clostridia]|uniref:RNA polymerase sigma factor n=1 Tax=Clostridia TaxID=186801 RepID=UPI001651F1CF|nr:MULTISPECIES: sigma factor-like helix-turn-helix DNA-binding protein [Clostridia]
MNQFKGHGCSTVNEIHVATGSAEMAVTAEREEFSLFYLKKEKNHPLTAVKLNNLSIRYSTFLLFEVDKKRQLNRGFFLIRNKGIFLKRKICSFFIPIFNQILAQLHHKRPPPSNLNFEKIQIGGVNMYGSKDKPYELIIEKSEKEIHYYIIYLTEGRRSAKIEISEAIYQVYKNSDLRQKSQENIFDRHIEHLDLTEVQLQKRAIYEEMDLENKVMDKLRNELLFEVIANLPDTQRSRFILYYEMDYTYDQIAQKEGCSKMAVKYSIDAARKKIIEKIKKFES